MSSVFILPEQATQLNRKSVAQPETDRPERKCPGCASVSVASLQKCVRFRGGAPEEREEASLLARAAVFPLKGTNDTAGKVGICIKCPAIWCTHPLCNAQ